jgi:cellulose synthase/poly-beta-1,6-N-acetylglucosamine synthase-like glycosyltransferase
MFDDPSGVRVASFPLPSAGLASLIPRGFVVAIPVRDEEERLPACLGALAQQRDQLGQPIPPTLVRIVVFANNCTDQSASLARRLGECLSLDLRVVEARLPPVAAHAGNARRAAMDLAEAWLVEGGERDGVILTTDADSQVGTNWIAENVAAFEAGAEAVLGRIDLDEEGDYLPRALHQRGELEDVYERLLTELSSLLDPLEHNPWPHHATISGASLGITRATYCRVGRLPRVPLGEDKALIALLSRQDAKIRYCPTAHVITSGRTNGRAPGGVADTLAIRSRDPDALCDDALEPFRTAFARVSWRGRLRRLHGERRLVLGQDWASELGILAAEVNDLIQGRHSARHGVSSRIEALCFVGDCSDRPSCPNRSPSRVVRSPASEKAAQARDNTSSRNSAYRSARSTTQVDPICSMKMAAASSPLRG